jgi:ribonuclease BN (tRNA processing enzyme)
VNIHPHVLKENMSIDYEKMSVRNTPTIHGKIESRAVKIQSEGKVFVYSSDTAPSQEFNSFARHADLLVHECNWLDGSHPEGVHTTPSELIHVVEEVEPSKLILTHLSPEVVQNKKKVLEIIFSTTESEVSMAEDLVSFEI